MSTQTAPPDLGWGYTGPMWGARAYKPKIGQDHLGLASVSADQILPRLSPGINVLTVHPRYWSFYSWVLDDFWSLDTPKSRATFKAFYRPREALFAAACHVCDRPEHATLQSNIVGSRRIASVARGSEVDPQFNYIDESLGGYGLYYRTTMEATHILVIARPSNGFPWDAPTPTGRALADAFRSAVAGTAVAAQLASGDVSSPVPHDALVEFGRLACLCQLRTPDAPDRPLLEDLFLHAGAPTAVAARHHSMRMLLDLSACRPDHAIDEDTYRQLIYFREIGDARYVPRTDLTDAARRWRVYQGREYLAFAFNRLLKWLSRRGLAETSDGLVLLAEQGLEDLIRHSLDDDTAADEAFPQLPAATADTRVSDFLAPLLASVPTTAGANDTWTRSPMDEHELFHLCGNESRDDGQTLRALIAMLLLLRERFGLPKQVRGYDDDIDLLSAGGSLRIGMSGFMHRLNQRLLTDPTLTEVLLWLIHDFVILQHERVAASKLPDDTYRLRRVGDGLRFMPRYVGAGFNDSRFAALSTMVHELGWVSSFREPQRTLTSEGRELLERGDLPEVALRAAAAPFEFETADPA